MELLGSSLEDIFQKQKKNLSIKTTCMLGIQMIDRIEWVHSKYIIHRDIKPDNFVMGRGDSSHIVYLLDFGLSKKYWSSHNKKHIKFSINKKLTGTARYASINALRGCEQSRRDDLEAIGYVLMYFLRGSLPWQGLQINKKEDRYKKIYEKKKATTAEDLCNGFPSEMCEYIKYTRNLEFEARPDYNYLRGLLKNIMSKNSFEFDYFYDWCKTKPVIRQINNAIPVENGNNINNDPNNDHIMMVNNDVNKIMKTEENENNKEQGTQIDNAYNAIITNEAQYNLAVNNLEENGIDSKKKDKDKKKKKNKDKENSKDGKKKGPCLIF